MKNTLTKNKIKDDEIDEILKIRNEKIRRTKEFLQVNFAGFKDESFAELTAESVLNSLESQNITTGMVVRHRMKKHIKKIMPVFVALLLAAGLGLTIYAMIQGYRANYYPHTVQVSKNFRFYSDSECAYGIDNVCAIKPLQEAINEQLNEMKEGDTITVNNGKEEVWTITRSKYHFTIVITRE